jgi:hypothetical protein
MLMLEDPMAVAQAGDVADLKGFSILACGIGSLTQALGGDRAGAEAGTQKVLAEAKRARLADMLTANPQDVAQRKVGIGGVRFHINQQRTRRSAAKHFPVIAGDALAQVRYELAELVAERLLERRLRG